MRYRQVPVFLAFCVLLLSGLCACAGPLGPPQPPSLSLNVVYSFANGENPIAGVVIGTNGNFYGTAPTVGTNFFGGVYEVTPDGVLAGEFFLNGTNGAAPMSSLIQGPGGSFYGTASRGGFQDNGTVFRLTPGGQIQLVAMFANTNGATPLAPLFEGTNGWFYGTTFNGGTNGLGSIFAVNEAGLLSNVFSFAGTNGANPAAGLIQGTDGNLYGTTEYGGDNGLGTVFRLTYAGALTNLGSFSQQTGAFPGGLAEEANGNFLGAAASGGPDLAGTIFELNLFSALQGVFSFGITNGDSPDSPLTLGIDGNWYGAAELGGASGLGTLFFLSSNRFAASVIPFEGFNGSYPRSGLVRGPDGNLYGTTSQGGSNGFGVIYQLAGFLPFVTKPPANQTWASNATARFSVTAIGSGPLSYQWEFDGTALAGATNTVLVVSHEQLTNAGTYTVIVSNAYGSISTNALLKVTAPTVTVRAPPAMVSNASLTISGTAHGPNGVKSVLAQLNSNGWSAVSGTTQWTTNITLQPGTNIFQVESIDPAGNPSAIERIVVFYTTVSSLTLQTNGLGSISTSFKGTNLAVGRGYTVRAIPGTGQLFLDWTGSVSTNSDPLEFVMQSNMVLRANFVTNPFIAAAGTYDGLFSDASGVAEQSAGLLRNLVIGKSGSYSGQIVIRGIAHGFTGSFDASEQSSATVARPTNEGFPMALNMTLTGKIVTGTVFGIDSGGWRSSLVAEEVETTGSARYTLIVPPGAGAPTDCPPGYGYALLTNHNGFVTLNGALADAATFTQSVPLVGNGDVPFYASLYGNTGLIFGWLNIDGGLTGTNVWWVAPSSSSPLYPAGFTNVFAIIASEWTKPPANYIPSGTLTISNSSLALDFDVSIANDTLIKEAGAPSNSLTGTLNPNTGLLKLAFGNGTGKATTTAYAAILGDSTNARGFFLTKTNGGAVLLQP
jgi:uncharacterized repeat protein (TIGR03803 family)